MLMNAKLNDTDHKMLCSEGFHTHGRIRKSMPTTGSTKIIFENFYGENRRSLVHSRSLDVSVTSLNEKKLRRI